MPDFAERFMKLALPALERGDAEALAQAVGRAFSTPDIAQLLQHPRVDVRQVSALAMGVLGGADAVGVMARALHDPEPAVVEMAEHGLWSIWFGLGRPEATESFARGVECLGEDRLDEALAELRDAVELDPDFAEARNQCAIANYLRGDYEASLRCCEQCVSLMPPHFGAIAGMGHVCVQLGRLEEALRHYRRARSIHPRMPGLDEHEQSLAQRLSSMKESQASVEADDEAPPDPPYSG